MNSSDATPTSHLETTEVKRLEAVGWRDLEVSLVGVEEGDPWYWVIGTLHGRRYSGASPCCARCAAQMLDWEWCETP
jgi:hypothetical protein